MGGLKPAGLDVVQGAVFAVTGAAVTAVSHAGTWAADVAKGVVAGPSYRARVRALEAQIMEVEGQRAMGQQVAAENARLRRLLGLRSGFNFETAAGRVVAGGTESSRMLTVDLGRGDGVAADAAVLAGAGLVGRVIRVAPGTALVQLLSDASSAAGVVIQRTRFQAVLVGTGSDKCELRHVPNLEDVRPGDVLITAGNDGIYPAGLPAGVVVAVGRGAGFFKDVEVRLAADPRRLTEVLVARNARRDGAAR